MCFINSFYFFLIELWAKTIKMKENQVSCNSRLINESRICYITVSQVSILQFTTQNNSYPEAVAILIKLIRIKIWHYSVSKNKQTYIHKIYVNRSLNVSKSYHCSISSFTLKGRNKREREREKTKLSLFKTLLLFMVSITTTTTRDQDSHIRPETGSYDLHILNTFYFYFSTYCNDCDFIQQYICIYLISLI